jgi:hypothetical protein
MMLSIGSKALSDESHRGNIEDLMVADLKNLSESLRESTPENYLRQIIRARKTEIESTLDRGEAFILRVPDGRQVRIARREKSTEETVSVTQ